MPEQSDTESMQVWQGDHFAVARSRAKFEEGPVLENLLPHASVLYSFRSDPENAQALVDLLPLLMEHEPKLIAPVYDKTDAKRFDRMDVLSTIYGWLSERLELGAKMCSHVRAAALRISRIGYQDSLLIMAHRKAHSRFLLGLTYASLTDDPSVFRTVTNDVAEAASWFVSDENQKARIYIKLGILLRKHGGLAYWLRGAYWGIRGVLVAGVPLNVRLKGLAALGGVTR